jgi:hypothetical protein
MANMDERYKYIFERRNYFLSSNEGIYNLCRDSYIGGNAYSADKYLINNMSGKEPPEIFDYRSQLVSYTNHVEPTLNIVIGSIYRKEPDRSKVPSFMDYAFKGIYKGKGLNLLMHNIGTQSELYPVAVLVDTPKIPNPITVAERNINNINPFIQIYKFNEIRDFALDDQGRIQWILLDNTYIDNSDPYSKPVTIVAYTLWDKMTATTFTKVSEKEVVVSPPVEHGLGEVPVVFSGFNNLDNDELQSYPFQNIALSSRKIYNVGSMIDSVLFNNTFQLLTIAGKAPDQIISKGYGSVGVLEYEMDSSNPPEFIKSSLDDTTAYINEIKRQSQDIYHQLGLKDPESEAVQYDSGKLKSIEYAQKTKNILYKIATELEHTENEIIRICALYEGKEIDPEIKYNTDFDVEDVNNIKNELDIIFKNYPYDSLRKEVAKQRAMLTLGEDNENIDKIINDIEGTSIEEVVTTTDVPTDNTEKNQE